MALDGYAGRLLSVKLNSRSIVEKELQSDVVRESVGGVGLGANLLLEGRQSVKQNWDDPDNPLMFLCGPLSGTRVSGSGTFCVVTQGPMTGYAASSQANGFFGAFLRTNGFDGLILQGKAEEWVYLLIAGGRAVIKPAEHLLGLDTYQLQDALQSELGISRRSLSVFGIGPAGENLVRFASIVGDYGHVAAHNGVGAVMGSKKVKAVAVIKDQHRVSVADPETLNRLAKEMYSHARQFNGGLREKLGTAGNVNHIHHLGQLPVKNYTTSVWPFHDRVDGHELHERYQYRSKPCWNCSLHGRWITIPDGPYAGFECEEPEYEGVAACSSVIDNKDSDSMIVLANLVDRLGLDINESGWVLGWAMEGYQKGWLARSMLGGIELTWGNVNGAMQLLKLVSRREGSGALFADGVKSAAEALGNAEAFNSGVFTLKGATPRGHDHRARWEEFLDTCLSNTGTIEVTGGYANYEEIGVKPPKNSFDPLEVARTNAQINGRRQFEDSLGICRFTCEDLQLLLGCTNAVTGWKLTIEDVLQIGLRAINRLRIFNLLNGLDPATEAPSPRYGSPLLDGPAQGVDAGSEFPKMRKEYWKHMGWDQLSGRPLPETLKKLGLAHWTEPLWTENKGEM